MAVCEVVTIYFHTGFCVGRYSLLKVRSTADGVGFIYCLVVLASTTIRAVEQVLLCSVSTTYCLHYMVIHF